jgi:hypothetical protein
VQLKTSSLDKPAVPMKSVFLDFFVGEALLLDWCSFLSLVRKIEEIEIVWRSVTYKQLFSEVLLEYQTMV